MRSHGFGVRPVETADMAAMKQSMGVPQEVWSCHTAVIDGYIVEGHVPIDAIEDLLRERPPIDGIALPGMPEGSPGMGGVKAGPLEILAVNGGKVSLFGSY